MKTRESLFNELNDLRQEMLGISPKLSIYQRLKDREKQILLELGNVHVEKPHVKDEIKLKTGVKYINRFQRPR